LVHIWAKRSSSGGNCCMDFFAGGIFRYTLPPSLRPWVMGLASLDMANMHDRQLLTTSNCIMKRNQ